MIVIQNNLVIRVNYMNGGGSIMRANPKMMTEFKFTYLDIDVMIQFPDNLTFITGDSADGKSFLYHIFEIAKTSDACIETFNYTSKSKDLLSIIKGLNDSLIIIDNADILLSDELRRHIAFDFTNQYVIIGRDPRELMLMSHQIRGIDFTNKVLTLVP